MTNSPELTAYLAALDTLRKADPIGLWRARDEAQQAVRGATFPALTLVPETDDDTAALACPHCDARLGSNASGWDTDHDIVAVDVSERWTRADELEARDVADRVVPICYDDLGEFDGLGYQCGACYGPVSLPEGWTEATR